MVDAPCGDMNWMRHVVYDFHRFIGVDILPRVIQQLADSAFPPRYEFYVGNIVTDQLPTADAVFCRDCLVHLPFAAIHTTIRQWAMAGFEYVLVTTFPKQKVNADIKLGEWRMLNMQLAPFYWPIPLMLLEDNDHFEYALRLEIDWGLASARPSATLVRGDANHLTLTLESIPGACPVCQVGGRHGPVFIIDRFGRGEHQRDTHVVGDLGQDTQYLRSIAYTLKLFRHLDMIDLDHVRQSGKARDTLIAQRNDDIWWQIAETVQCGLDVAFGDFVTHLTQLYPMAHLHTDI